MTIQRITEENGKAVIDGWYTRAREMNPSDLGEFVRHLCEDYQHDYGTVVHACAAAAVAAAWSVSHGNSGGGITGFQAGAVFWSFYQRWMSEDGPARLMKFEKLLYPQYDDDHHSISSFTWKWLRETAKKKLADSPPLGPFAKRWADVAEGIVPPGWVVERERTSELPSEEREP